MNKYRRMRPWALAIFMVCCLTWFAGPAAGAVKTNYVSLTGSQTPPYDTWANAFTNLIEAAQSTSTADGDTILVTNGVYMVTNQVLVTNAITIISLSGATNTTVTRATSASTRIFYLSNSLAVLDGFTVTNGDVPVNPTMGIGIYIYAGTVQNCVIKGNQNAGANTYGGGVGMASGGLLRNSLVANNLCQLNGGGVYGGTVANCVIQSNSVGYYNDHPTWGPGGGVYNSVVKNSLIADNQPGFGKPGGGAANCTLQNCTIVNNMTYGVGGGVANSTVQNCIVYFNTAYGSNTNMNYAGNCDFSFSCTTPLAAGMSNTTVDPHFVNRAAGNYRLLPGSPGADTGTNGSWAVGTNDLDGNPWVVPIDMGAYAFNSTNSPFRCNFVANVREGFAPLTVTFTGYAAGTNTTGLRYYWDVNNDGTVDQPDSRVATNTYAAGLYNVSLIVSNAAGEKAGYTNMGYIIAAPTTTIYVATNGGHSSPFTSWATAATNLFSALDLGIDGTTILCSNGTFGVTNQLVLSKGITIRGLNGATNTTIRRSGTAYYRVFALAHTNALLDGLQISNGYLDFMLASGIYIGAGTVQNCVIKNNSVYNQGGAVYLYGGLLRNSQIVANYSYYGGGVIMSGGLVENCVIMNNTNGYFGGAGVMGGGPYNAGLIGGTARGCLIVGNVQQNAYQGGGAWRANLENCTIISNTASTGVGGGVSACTLSNCIVYFNTATGSGGTYSNYNGGTFAYSCTAPLAAGTDNTASDPQFVNGPGGDYRLQAESPCVNTGTNLSWMIGAIDINGNGRIRKGRVDMGAYEYQPSAGTIFGGH